MHGSLSIALYFGRLKIDVLPYYKGLEPRTHILQLFVFPFLDAILIFNSHKKISL